MHAPRFCLPDQEERRVCLRDLLAPEKYVLVFFYPRDLTSGCTVEAVALSRAKRSLAAYGVRIVGISKLTPASKRRFAQKNDLRLTLLSDEDCAVADAYGVWREKVMYGKKVRGIARESFLINARGIIVAHWERVTPATHAEEVRAFMRSLRERS